MPAVHTFDYLLSYAPWVLYCFEKWLPIRNINNISFLFGICDVFCCEFALHKCVPKLSWWFHPYDYALYPFDNELLSRYEEYNPHVNQREDICPCHNLTRVDSGKYRFFFHNFNLWDVSDFERLEKRKDNIEIERKKSDWIIIRKYQCIKCRKVNESQWLLH